MPFNNNTADNERKKFRDAGSEQSAIAVVGGDGEVLNGSMWTLPKDTVTASYPSDTVEVYSSRIGGVSGSVQEVVTVTYTDNTKEALASVVRT